MNERLKTMLLFLQFNYGMDSQQELAEKIGCNRSAISAAKNGDERYCNSRFLHRINSAFGNPFSAEWIETGNGEMLSAKQTIIGNNNHHSQNTAPADLFDVLKQSQKQIDVLLSQQAEFLRISSAIAQQNTKLIEKLTK